MPAATVQSNDRFRCHAHGKEIITTPKNKSVQPNHRKINKQQSKFVRSYRRNTQYVKSSLLVDEEIEGQPIKGLFTAKIFTSPLNPNKPVKEKDKETSIKLSKIHVKPINIGIQDLTIVDKELGIIQVDKDKIKQDVGRRRRIEQQVQFEINHNLVDHFGNRVENYYEKKLEAEAAVARKEREDANRSIGNKYKSNTKGKKQEGSFEEYFDKRFG